MEKTVMFEIVPEENDAHLRQMYLKVVSEPNHDYFKTGFIKCPECSEEILMNPSLRVMSEAIETHVKAHKETLKTNPIVIHSKSINIRLDLAQQVLLKASNKFQ